MDKPETYRSNKTDDQTNHICIDSCSEKYPSKVKFIISGGEFVCINNEVCDGSKNLTEITGTDQCLACPAGYMSDNGTCVSSCK